MPRFKIPPIPFYLRKVDLPLNIMQPLFTRKRTGGGAVELNGLPAIRTYADRFRPGDSRTSRTNPQSGNGSHEQLCSDSDRNARRRPNGG